MPDDDDAMLNIVRLAVQKDQPRDELLAELNRDNCVVLDGARTKVLRFEDDEYDAGGEHYVYRVSTFLTFDDFRNFYLNRHIMAGKPPKQVSIGSWWLGHPDRRQYRGVIFKPGGEGVVDGKLNLWRGWGVEPKRGEWGLLREHMYEVMAARDDDVDRYTFNWIAWAVQHPAEQAETAIVFIGEPGTGKGTLGKALCRIFGPHALHLSAAEDLTGKFNAHLRQCSFLFGDECCGPKDKRAEGQLKRMITENTLMIEPKGRDKVRVQNRLHTMLASNHDHVIPASAYERRYVVNRVADTHRQDAQWFEPIYQQLKNGGYEAMLFELLDHNLGDWHPRQIVRTAALAEQQEKSLEPLDAWFLAKVHRLPHQQHQEDLVRKTQRAVRTGPHLVTRVEVEIRQCLRPLPHGTRLQGRRVGVSPPGLGVPTARSAPRQMAATLPPHRLARPHGQRMARRARRRRRGGLRRAVTASSRLASGFCHTPETQVRRMLCPCHGHCHACHAVTLVFRIPQERCHNCDCWRHTIVSVTSVTSVTSPCSTGVSTVSLTTLL
jgi:hypothetical protein